MAEENEILNLVLQYVQYQTGPQIFFLLLDLAMKNVHDTTSIDTDLRDILAGHRFFFAFICIL